MTARLNSYERKPGTVADGSHKIYGGTENVDLAKGAATGMALEGSTIVTDTDVTVKMDDALAIEKFMAEELLVQMHDPSSEAEPQFVELSVNGDYRLAVRDSTREVKLKRYHVAILAQSKTASLHQNKVRDNDGAETFRERIQLRLSYPFSVLHDPSGGNGAAWLRKLLTSATV